MVGSYSHGSADPHHLFQKSFHLASFLALAALLRPRVCECTLSVSCHLKRNRRVSTGLREGIEPRARTKPPLAPWEETPQAPQGHRAGTLGLKLPVYMAGTLGSELPVLLAVEFLATPQPIPRNSTANTSPHPLGMGSGGRALGALSCLGIWRRTLDPRPSMRPDVSGMRAQMAAQHFARTRAPNPHHGSASRPDR